MNRYNSLRPGQLAVGDLVVVGLKFAMSDTPPFSGTGKYERDALTDTVWRVCGLRHSGYSVLLADREAVDCDASDEEYEISLRRLSKVGHSSSQGISNLTE